MRETLSKSNDISVSCEELEYYHLHLIECDEEGYPYRVAGMRQRWDASSGSMITDHDWDATFPTLEEAKQGYTQRRADVVREGFVYSDMDMF